MKLNYKLVKVTWVDATGVTTAWCHFDKFELEKDNIVRCISVGYLICDDASKVIIAPHVADYDDPENIQIAGLMTIPRFRLLEIDDLFVNSNEHEFIDNSKDEGE